MSIGVIGGADGPTAIYVTSSVNWPLLIGVITIVLAGSITGFLLWRKTKQ
jgi:LPXTG-motif cell wall-anchored protein